MLPWCEEMDPGAAVGKSVFFARANRCMCKCTIGVIAGAQGTGRDPKDQWKDMGAFGRLGVDWHGWAAVV